MTGGIELSQEHRWWLNHNGSLAVVCDVNETNETRAAARHMIDLLGQGHAVLLVVYFSTATVIELDLNELTARIVALQ